MPVSEIAPDVFRISTYIPEINLQFNQFLVRDDEPLLYHTGMKALFPQVREAVASVVDLSRIRWIGFSHFEADECGALNEWLELAPAAQPVCGMVGALVSVNDFAIRPARAMDDEEELATGQYRFRFLRTPHLPHCWEAGHLIEETHKTFFCSDLFHQNGDVEPLTETDVVGRARDALLEFQAGPLANYLPYTNRTDAMLARLAAYEPRTLAAMHGSAYAGDGAQALRDLADVYREALA